MTITIMNALVIVTIMITERKKLPRNPEDEKAIGIIKAIGDITAKHFLKDKAKPKPIAKSIPMDPEELGMIQTKTGTKCAN